MLNYKMTSYESQKMRWDGKKFIPEGKPELFGEKASIQTCIVRVDKVDK